MDYRTRGRTPAFSRLLLLSFVVLFLTACEQRGSGSSNVFGNTGGGGFTNDFLTGSGTGSSGSLDFSFDEDTGTMDMGSGFESASNSLESTIETLQQSGGDPKLIQGLGEAAGSLNEFAQAFSALTQGLSPTQVFQQLPPLVQAKQRAIEVAQLLWQLGYPNLAWIFAEEASKIEILRFYHPTASRHFFTTSVPEGFNAQILHGYVYEGVAFRVYRQPRNECKRALMRCYVPEANDHFMSTDTNCEGRTRIGAFGYVCAKRQSYAYPAIHRLWSGYGDHLATINEAEVQNVIHNLRWKYEGVLGYAPN